MEWMGMIFVLTVVAVWLHRVRGQFRKAKSHGKYRGGAALGNALQSLQAIVQPHAKHVIEARLDEDVDEDDDGEPKDPRAHLLQQARMIRRGEDIGRLTVRLPSCEDF